MGKIKRILRKNTTKIKNTIENLVLDAWGIGLTTFGAYITFTSLKDKDHLTAAAGGLAILTGYKILKKVIKREFYY